jgi:hypothetical protein
MSISRHSVALVNWAGLLVAGMAWAINTQLGQILPYLDCQREARFCSASSLIGAFAAGLACVVSWRSASRLGTAAPNRTAAFVGLMSAIAGMVFTFALSMQGVASLVLSGCER